MPGVFLLNPDRYMTKLMCALPGVQFAWTTEHLLSSGLDIDDWKGSMRARDIRHMEISMQEARRVVNPDFNKSFWRNRYKPAIFDPDRMSPIGKVMTPAGLLAPQNGLYLRPWIGKFAIPVKFSHLDSFRVRFNTVAVLYAATNLDLEVISVVMDRGDSMRSNQYIAKDKRSDYRVTCDTCVINHRCEYARKGSVCILPNSDAGVFAKMIGSRDTQEVLAGLRLMVTRNGQRLEDAIEAENPGEPTKEVTGLMNSVFNQAIALAKLQDPSLRASPKIQIGINTGQNSQVTVEGSTQPSSSEIANVLQELMDHGLSLEDITQEKMIAYMAAKSSGDLKQIAAVINEGQVVEADASPY